MSVHIVEPLTAPLTWSDTCTITAVDPGGSGVPPDPFEFAAPDELEEPPAPDVPLDAAPHAPMTIPATTLKVASIARPRVT
ncbi:MAG: hypothetical protein JOY80_07110 [Candidatus Dormibacteraeota bacterium]|nr:hypothetical protein [Candidatus Dormibacteraeota bacterium]